MKYFLSLIFLFGSSLFAIPNPALYSSIDKAPDRYHGPVDIEFNAFSVAIRTERLLIRSIEKQDLPHMIELFADPVVMEKYMTGVPLSQEKVEARFERWYNRWQMMDPYSSFAITLIDENENYPFIGLITLGHGDVPGESEVAFLLHKQYWNQKYGKEAATAIIHGYGSLLMLKGFGPEGVPLKQIVATARTDNVFSIKLLESLGMERIDTIQEYGSERYRYAIDSSHLRPN